MHRKISHERPPRVKTPKAIPVSAHVRVAQQHALNAALRSALLAGVLGKGGAA